MEKNKKIIIIAAIILFLAIVVLSAVFSSNRKSSNLGEKLNIISKQQKSSVQQTSPTEGPKAVDTINKAIKAESESQSETNSGE